MPIAPAGAARAIDPGAVGRGGGRGSATAGWAGPGEPGLGHGGVGLGLAGGVGVAKMD